MKMTEERCPEKQQPARLHTPVVGNGGVVSALAQGQLGFPTAQHFPYLIRDSEEGQGILSTSVTTCLKNYITLEHPPGKATSQCVLNKKDS